jgi:hypothetical protein
VSIMAIYRVAGIDRETFNRLRARAPIDPAPEEGTVHQVAFDDNGIVVVEIWENEAALRAFNEERVRPALSQLGLPMMEPEILDVHALWIREGANRRNIAAPPPKDSAPRGEKTLA